MTDHVQVTGAVLDEDGKLSKLVVEQEDHTTKSLDVTPQDFGQIQYQAPDLVALTGGQIINAFSVASDLTDDPSWGYGWNPAPVVREEVEEGYYQLRVLEDSLLRIDVGLILTGGSGEFTLQTRLMDSGWNYFDDSVPKRVGAGTGVYLCDSTVFRTKKDQWLAPLISSTGGMPSTYGIDWANYVRVRRLG